MRKLHLYFCILFLFILSGAEAQWQKISTYSLNDNQFIEGYSFISPTEGYIGFIDYGAEDFIGYTTDGGITYTKRSILIPELPIGINLSGVYALNTTTVFVYGAYLLQPVILKSSDKGVTWQLAFLAPAGTPLPQNITGIQFTSPTTGFAISQKRLLKTTNGGSSWALGSGVTGPMNELSFVSETEGYIAAVEGLYKVSGALNNVTFVSALSGKNVYHVAATGPNKLFVETNDGIYYSSNGAVSFTKKTISEASLDYSVSQWHFFNDSTGIAQMGAGIYRTNNSAQTWELMTGDQNDTSKHYSFQALYFYDQQTGYQSASGPVTFRTTNQGGIPLPKAVFRVDLSLLSSQNKVSLNNLSSKGYSYTWKKNGQVIATTYDASYTSQRLQKDTVELIITNSTGSDTSVQYIETRVPNFICNADAVITKDTSTVKLFPADTLLNYRTHEWQMGNGITLYNIRPVYQYPQKGTYTIKHILRDPVSGCTSTKSYQVIISKLTNCDAAISNINPIITDTFLNNTFTFQNLQTDFAGETLQRFTWFFGDGDSSTFASLPVHAYKNSGEYLIKVILQFNNGLCYKEFYDTLQVLLTECNGNFRMKRAYAKEMYDWEAHPLDKADQKKHIWVFDNKDTISTGATAFIQHKYSSNLLTFGTQYCVSSPFYIWHNLDSANRIIRHIVIDTVTGCRSEDTMHLKLTFDGNELNLWQSMNNPYNLNYLTRGAITCVTREGIQSTGVLSGSWGYPVHGTYAINGSYKISSVVDIYRRTITIDGEYRYFQQGQEKNEVIGRVYLDLNKNGIRDANEPPYTQQTKVTGTANGKTSTTYSENGVFRFTIDSGLVNVQLFLQKPYYSVTPSPAIIDFRGKIGRSDTVTFALQRITGVKDGQVSIIPLSSARPGFRARYHVPVAAIGNDTIFQSTLRLIKDSRITIDSITPAPASVNGNIITWNIDTLVPGQLRTIRLSGLIAAPPVVNGNDTLQYSIKLDGYGGEVDTLDNQFLLQQNVVNSFDPNDKRENRGGQIRKTEIDSSVWIYYMIRFQNTGNAAAYNVMVRDTLETKLNWNSFEMQQSSHANKLTVENGNQLCWLFKNIYLPDSTHDKAGSNGFVLFRIKANTNLLIGDTIRNRAGIYFDFNLPIITGQSKLGIRTGNVVTGIADLQPLEGSIRLAPNPAQTFTQVIIKAKLKGKSVIVLRNSDGRKMLEKIVPATGNEQLIIPFNFQSLPPGIYFITVMNNGKVLTQQLVLQ